MAVKRWQGSGGRGSSTKMLHGYLLRDFEPSVKYNEVGYNNSLICLCPCFHTTAMAKRTLYLATYTRGNYSTTGKVKPYHWSYFIQIELKDGQNLGIAHQLRGMPGGFYYQGPEEVDLAKSGSLKEVLEIGEVDESQLGRVHDILKTIRIEKSESSGWNCQDWALDGLDMLKEEGFIYDYLTQDALKHWLKEEA